MTAALVKGNGNHIISVHLENILHHEYHGFLGIISGASVLGVFFQLSRDNQILGKVGNWSPINN